MQCVSASKPVAAVTRGGIETVSSGSRIAAFAIRYGLEDDGLAAVRLERDDARATDLAAGARRGRDGDDRRNVRT